MTTVPFRVQLCRRKGWKLPANTVCVTRPGKWGNPFKIGVWFKPVPEASPCSHFSQAWKKRSRPHMGYTKIENRRVAVEWFEKFLKDDPRTFLELRGKNLACWCPLNEPCHAEILLRLANA
jgi:hypothetical protein